MSILEKTLTKSENVITRNIAGETLIVPVRASVGDLDSIYTLDEVASSVWRMVDGRRSLAEIVNAVCDEYEVSPEVAERDVAELACAMEEAGLVRSEARGVGQS